MCLIFLLYTWNHINTFNFFQETSKEMHLTAHQGQCFHKPGMPTGCRPPPSSSKPMTAARNHLNKYITPLFPTGIGE
jgi:hypothetical protein